VNTGHGLEQVDPEIRTKDKGMAQKVKFKVVEGGEPKEYEAHPGKVVNLPKKGEPYTFPSKDDGDIVTKPVREVREKKPGKLWIVKDDEKVHALEVEDK
jgi:hypothetical protein